MPVERCTVGGKPGYRYGSSGKCYHYMPGNATSRNRAKARAKAQGQAIRASGYTENRRKRKR